MTGKFKKTILLLLLLPFLLIAIKTVSDLRKSASSRPANIIIDTQPQTNTSIDNFFWQNLAQGGEQTDNMIQPVLELTRDLNPKIIRIDHVFDYYDVYLSPGQYDFTRLDQVINSILYTGATPMLSLSYIPSSMNQDDHGQPQNWTDWSNLVTATARHYSVEKKIDGIYYEVYNEPDLFGAWHYGKSPNYTTLFINTVKAVANGAGSSSYFIGAPATTDLYKNWVDSILKTAQNNNFKLDFISFHHYSKNIESFLDRANSIKNILSRHPNYQHLKVFITETGPDSEKSDIYSSPLSAYHLLSLITQTYGHFDKIFTFEIVDGPDQVSWGILPHPNHNLPPRPRYHAFKFLNQLTGQELTVTGNGSWVSALASKDQSVIKVLLVNYDPNNQHHETFPLILRNIDPGQYQIKTTNFDGTTSTKIVDTTFAYRDQVYLPPNTAQLLEFTPQ